MIDQHDDRNQREKHDKAAWREGCPIVLLNWIDRHWNGVEPLPDAINGIAVPDATQWGDRLSAEIAYRIDDVAGADAAFSELMGVAPATEAQVRSNVVAGMRKEAAKVVAEAEGEAKGMAKTIAAARAPLAKGTPERKADADTRRSTMRAKLSLWNQQNKKEGQPQIEPCDYEEALIDAGVVTRNLEGTYTVGKKTKNFKGTYTVRLNKHEATTVSRATFKADLKNIREGKKLL